MSTRHLLWILLAACLASTPAAAADPFYENLMSEGALAHDRGDHREAARKLRIACFGFLEEPQLLCTCAVRLATAHAAAGDRDGFDQAFQRVVELERRFGAYGAADLPPDVRAEFEDRVAAWVPTDSLADLAGFQPIRRRVVESRLASLPPEQRRRELEGLAAADPGDPDWRRRLARLEVDERNPVTAREWTRQLLAIDPDDPEALCLDGRAAAQTASCAEAVAGLAACTEGPRTAREVEDEVGCLVAAGLLDEAAARLAMAPPDLLQTRPVRRLSRQLEEAGREAAEAASRAEAEAAARQAAAAARSPERLAELRAAIERGSDLETLRALAGDAASLADADPTWVEAQRLAGEAAYRVALWPQAVRFLERAGIGAETEPALYFYLAVSRYENGDRAGAAAALSEVLPHLRRSPVVERYAAAILGDS